MQTYKDLIVWQKSFLLVQNVYKITKTFPVEERFTLVSQIRRAAVSIPSNIAEGYRRRSPQEWRQFVHIAFGSAAELETQLLLANKIGFLQDNQFAEIDRLMNDVLRLLNGLCRSLR